MIHSFHALNLLCQDKPSLFIKGCLIKSGPPRIISRFLRSADLGIFIASAKSLSAEPKSVFEQPEEGVCTLGAGNLGGHYRLLPI